MKECVFFQNVGSVMRCFIYPFCLSIRNTTIEESLFRKKLKYTLVRLEATREHRLANVLAGNSREKKRDTQRA